MRAILDESLPKSLAAAIAGHEIVTAKQMGWDGLDNGELLSRLQAAGYRVLVTADRKMEYQQNLARFDVGLVVLRPRANRIGQLLPLVDDVTEAISSVQPGRVIRVVAPGYRLRRDR